VLFTKRLRDGVRRGDITCSIRIWTRPHVAVARRYRMEEGEIEVESVLPIRLDDITPELARASGFKGVVDLSRSRSMAGASRSTSCGFTRSVLSTASRPNESPIGRAVQGSAWPGGSVQGMLGSRGPRNKESKLTKRADSGGNA
jgi:hypothetical protein